MRKKVNEKLNLAIQLHDGLEDKRVFATITDQDNVELEAEFEISHISAGLFNEQTQVMPSEETIFIIYRITESDGTTLASQYASLVQRVDIDTGASGGGSCSFSDIVGVVSSQGETLGEILENGNIIGLLDQDTVIIGSVDESELVGVIPEPVEIIGTITC